MNAPQNRAESGALTLVDQTAPYQTSSLMLNPQLMTQMMAVAQSMSEAAVTVPAHFRGKPGDCLAVVMQATQWNMNPFAVAQKTHVVNGTLGYEAQLVHAVLQATGAIEGTFHYDYRGTGPALECRVGAVCKGDKDLTWNEWLSMSSVTTRNSPLWKTNPPQQMGYLQVKNWARAFKPGAILGVYTTDELQSPATEKFMGPADVVGQQTTGATSTEPAYPDADFKANVAQWTAVIEKGKKTAAQIIAMVNASGKGLLTEPQKATLLSVKSKSTDATDKGAKGGDAFTAPTYAEVAGKLTGAKNLDELNEGGDLIKSIADDGQRGELQALFNGREAELTPKE